MNSAKFRGGPQDGERVSTTSSLPSDLRFPVAGDNATWEHAYTLRGTSATGYFYEHAGFRLVAPSGERIECPSCDAVLR